MAEPVDIINIDLTELNQEANESKKTLKELRDEIKDLRTQLEETEIGTEEFTDTLDKLTAAQEELKTATKATAVATEGSYNAMVKQMADLKKQWRETGDAIERAALGEKIKQLNNDLKSLDETIGNHQRNVGNYGSVLTDLGNTVRGSSEAVEGITHSFGSALLVMNAMGVESDELSQLLMKMQLAMSFTKGLKDLEKGTKLFTKLGNAIKQADLFQKIFNTDQKAGAVAANTLATAETGVAAATTSVSVAMKVLKAALISTGIGALIVAVGALYNGLTKLIERIKEANTEADKYKDTNDQLNESFDEMNAQTEREIRLMKAQGASLDEIHKKRVGNLKAEEEMIVAKMKSIQLDIEQLKAHRRLFDGGNKKIKQWTEAYDELNGKLKELHKNIKTIDADFDIDKRIEDINNYKKSLNDAATAAQKARKEWEEFLKSRKANQNKINDINEQAQDILNRQVAADASAAEKRKKNRDADLAELRVWYDKQAQMYLDDMNAEKKALENRYNNGLISKKKYNANLANIEANYRKADESLTIVYNEKEAKIIEDYNAKEIEEAKKAADEKVKVEKEANDKIVEQVQRGYQLRMALLDAEFNERSMKYELLGDDAGLAKLNEQFITSQLQALQTLRAGLLEAKQDVSEVDIQIKEMLTEQQRAFMETMTTSLQSLHDQFNESISGILAIGDGLSTEWGNVFQSLTDGIENVTAQLKSGEKGWRQYANMAVSAMNVASSVLTALADEQDEQSKEGFEQQKKYQIGAATMNMLAGIVSAWTSAMNPANSWMTIWGQLAAGAAMTAMIVTTGLMQISKIKQQKFNGESSGGVGAVATPSMTAMQAMDTGVNTTSIIQGASTEGQVSETKVYVLESDITSTVNKVSVSQGEATY